MDIDPEEARRIEDSLVHDTEDDRQPEGIGIYLTARFLSKVLLAAYGLTMVASLFVHVLISGGGLILISLKPQAVLMGLSMALGAVFFYLSSGPDPELSKQRTWKGRLITLGVVFIVMQVISVLLWLGLAKAFSL
jgi:hypothetical protein